MTAAEFTPPVDPSGDAPKRASTATATFCATLVDEWIRAGVRHAVVAPGSRSTPMTLALAARDELQLHVHHDERAAGFMALGLGIATGLPAVVLTTSGTAAVELHPAVVEAHQAAVPMIVVTADRPPELHHFGAPQTVDQQHLFGRSVRWFTDPGVPDGAASSSWRSLAARLVAEATTGGTAPGPVHLNLPFREPLVGRPGPLPDGRPDGAQWHTTVGRRSAVDRFGTARLAEILESERGVIVAGAGCGEPRAVLALAEATGWPVLADPRSGVRVPHPLVVAAADPILRGLAASGSLRPEVVLRLGALPASKVVSEWLAASGSRQVAVGGDDRWFDPARTATHVLHADPDAVLAALPRLIGGDGPGQWAALWLAAEQAAQSSIDSVIAGHEEPTEPGVARAVLGALPEDASLIVSSSMPIRDVEWYGGARTGVSVLANRGANGIDGVVSTAVGVALAARGSGRATVVLVGDVAFLHDSNALLGSVAREIDLTVVVVDNNGGGIFSFLPQANDLEADRFEKLFGTPHGVDLSVLVAAHGLTTVEPVGSAEVSAAVTASVAAGGVRLVRIVTDREANVSVHQEIHDAVEAAVSLALTGDGSRPADR
ncbi:MAG: 2-succinyl-5-enolpyruvyl-6-hydroxy-3-cyclohexene-1-carboxylic-acid synthase [Aquihabitans sp.]